MSTTQPTVPHAGVGRSQAEQRRQAVLQSFVLLTVVLHSAWVGTALIVWPHHTNFNNRMTLWWGPWSQLVDLPMYIALRAYVFASCALAALLTLGLWVAAVRFSLNAGLARTAAVGEVLLYASFFYLAYRQLWDVY